MRSPGSLKIEPAHSATDIPAGNGLLAVDLDAVVENFHLCRHFSGAPAAAVVKANAYGFGMEPVARTLAKAGCDTFFVARLEEGMALRPIVPGARIFVLDGVAPETAAIFIAHRLTPVLNALWQITAWAQAASGSGTVLDAALHVDTGMNRLGLPAEELSVLAARPQRRLLGINPVLVMSHLACAEDASAPMNADQLARFRAVLAMLPPAPASLAASGGILLGKDYAFDLVRPGIGLYGGNPRLEAPNPFKTSARLSARVLQVRRVDKGEGVGYAATFRAKRPTTLATVGLGYADGLMRAIGNRGAGAIAGKRAPVVGRVSMDLVTLDVTDIPGVQIGTDVEFFGDTISLEDIAQAAGTASYEVLTGIGPRVERRYTSAS